MPGYHGGGGKKRKSYGGGGGTSHMDRGLSYANAPQGYRDDSGKPMGSYGHPPNGYINQSGMPNAGALRRMMDYMSNYYSNTGVNNSTDAGTGPNVASMDRTYKKGPVSRPQMSGGGKYA